MAEQVTARTLDFTNVKEGSDIRPKRKLAGEYLATVASVTENESKAGNAQWVFVVKLVDDPSATYPVYCTLNDEALWKLRAFIMACGANVQKKRIKIDPNKFVGRQLGVILEDDEYDGKEKSTVQGFIPKSELASSSPQGMDDDEEEDEDAVEEAPPARKTPAKKAAPAKKTPAKRKPVEVEEDEEDEVDEEELDELDLDEL